MRNLKIFIKANMTSSSYQFVRHLCKHDKRNRFIINRFRYNTLELDHPHLTRLKHLKHISPYIYINLCIFLSIR